LTVSYGNSSNKHAGKNAHLDIKSEAGKAIVHLTAEVDAHADQEQQRAQPRNGPARQWRREKRAAARDTAEIVNAAAAETADHQVKVVENTNTREASGEDTLKNIDTLKKSESEENKVAEKVAKEKAESISAENASNHRIDELDDEICSDESYQTKQESSLSYSAAAAPKRKLGGVDYFKMFPPDYMYDWTVRSAPYFRRQRYLSGVWHQISGVTIWTICWEKLI
jgi:hypothetical protein